VELSNWFLVEPLVRAVGDWINYRSVNWSLVGTAGSTMTKTDLFDKEHQHEQAVELTCRSQRGYQFDDSTIRRFDKIVIRITCINFRTGRMRRNPIRQFHSSTIRQSHNT